MDGSNWGFYGRKKEMDGFRTWMGGDSFTTIAVIGSRRVGKTELIRETIARKPDARHIYLRIPEVDGTEKEKYLNTEKVNALKRLNRKPDVSA